jgi:hypothetical protein
MKVTMKSKTKQNQVKILDALRADLLTAVAELDLKGTNSKVTQAMCIIEEAFNSFARGRQPSAKQIFLSGMSKAKLVG